MSIATRSIYFKSGQESLFGWLHQPPEKLRSGLGVVICKPFGYEAVCAHRSIRAFADACATAGATVLRFDYTGTGDSSGGDSNADQIDQWCSDIRAAMEALRQTSHVTRIGLLGVRFGALLASLVASTDPSVEAIMAVAPIVNGRRYVRELRAFQVTSSAESAQGGSEGTPASEADSDGGMEITGFHLSQASVDRLAKIDLTALGGHAVANALVLDRSDLAGAKPWADALVTLGTAVRYGTLPGYLEMVSTPHAAQVPREMVTTIVDYLAQRGPARQGPDRHRSARSAASEHSTSIHLTADDGSRIVERAVFVDAEKTLFAITTELEQPAAPTRARPRHGVVMLNGGAISHIGPNRMYVDLARQWAARGYCVLRLDLAGLGDSATRPGQSGNEVYPPGALDDVAAAIEYLRREFAVEDVTLAGLCAGAYHALRSAVSGLPVKTVLLVNPLTFYWKQGSKLSDLQVAEVVRNPGIYAEALLSGKSWRKLLRGRVNLWRVLMVFIRRALLAAGSHVRDLCRQLNIRLPQDLGWDLRSLTSRGVRVVFLFARGDGGENLLKIQGGSAIRALGDRCRIHIIDGADHVFSQGRARRQLLKLLTSELPY